MHPPPSFHSSNKSKPSDLKWLGTCSISIPSYKKALHWQKDKLPCLSGAHHNKYQSFPLQIVTVFAYISLTISFPLADLELEDQNQNFGSNLLASLITCDHGSHVVALVYGMLIGSKKCQAYVVYRASSQRQNIQLNTKWAEAADSPANWFSSISYSHPFPKRRVCFSLNVY